ncbi:MAG TPA: RsiV family protein [Pyrinomonadaceae bacterium]|nr:RsiV family protein [Pyrinomonadaceae bacterium]
MLPAYRLCFLSILVSISACGFHRNQLANKVSSIATPTPEVLAETVPQKPVQSRPIETEWKNRFTFKTHSISEKHDGYCPYELSAEYPEAASNNIAVKRFNRWIKRKVLSDVARFRRLELRAEPRARRLGKPSITEGLELTFRMYYSDKWLISFRLTHSVMAAGHMHPIDYYETINYDLRQGRPLRAGDLFKRGYLKAFSEFSRKWLSETYEIPNENWFREGTAPRTRNFPNWNVVPDGILISFEDYQVSSHNFGQPELIVPYPKLKRALRRNPLINGFVSW